MYGVEQIVKSGVILDVYYLINSDSKHYIFVDKKNSKYIPSDYRGESQYETIENNIINIG